MVQKCPKCLPETVGAGAVGDAVVGVAVVAITVGAGDVGLGVPVDAKDNEQEMGIYQTHGQLPVQASNARH
jgi:hypothetical protein